jgi:hypothetical protein
LAQVRFPAGRTCVVELTSTISKHLKTVSETFLSCDQSTWLLKGLQQIHPAGYKAHSLPTPVGL